MRLSKGDIERYDARVDTSPDWAECWPYRGAINNKGYGRFSTWVPIRRRLLAHRVQYFLTWGHLPPVVMHTCDNPICCNPRHLVGGTQADNIRDMRSKGRMDLTGLAIGQQRTGPQRKRTA